MPTDHEPRVGRGRERSVLDDPDAYDRETARLAEGAVQQRDAVRRRITPHENDPLRFRGEDDDRIPVEETDDAASEEVRWEGTAHPNVEPELSQRGGWDRIVSVVFPYSQEHWREELVAAQERAHCLYRAAGAEIEALDAQIAELQEQRRAWALQATAHASSADALERVRGQLEEEVAAHGEKELSEASARVERAGRRMRGGR